MRSSGTGLSELVLVVDCFRPEVAEQAEEDGESGPASPLSDSAEKSGLARTLVLET